MSTRVPIPSPLICSNPGCGCAEAWLQWHASGEGGRASVEDLFALVRQGVRRADRASRGAYAAAAQVADVRGIEQRVNVADVLTVVAGILEDVDHLREVLEVVEGELGRAVLA